MPNSHEIHIDSLNGTVVVRPPLELSEQMLAVPEFGITLLDETDKTEVITRGESDRSPHDVAKRVASLILSEKNQPIIVTNSSS